MKNVCQLYSRQDLVVQPSDEWRQSVYAQRICSVCTTLQRTDPCLGFGIDLDSEDYRARNPDLESLVGPIVGIWNVDAVIVREDLACDLQLEERGCCLGQISLGGKSIPGYRMVVAPRRLAIPIQNDRILRVGQPCSGCGYVGRRMDFNATFWFHKEDVQGLEVFSDELGKSLYVVPSVLSALRSLIRQELDPKEIEVR